MTDPRPDQAALAMLATLQTLMLAALYTGTPPHPPVAVAPFAIAPFLSVAIGTAFAAMVLSTHRAGHALSGLAAVLALVSFGPQKYFDAAFPLIWPAVIAAQISTAFLVAKVFFALRGRQPA